MVSKFWREWRHPVEFALLLALAFFLPLREAPKNLLWAAYLIVWLVNRTRSRDFGGPVDRWDVLFGALVISGYLAAAFAGIRRGDGNEWLAVNDLLRYGLLFVCVRRAGYSAPQSVALLGMLVGSCVLAEGEALWNWKVSGSRPRLELYSVGHVNHSAIYMTICLGIAGGILLGCWTRLRRVPRAMLCLATLAMLTGLLLTGSRAAAAVGLLLLIGMAMTGATHSGLGRGAWAAVLVTILIAVAGGGTEAIQRQIENARIDNVLSERDLIWNRGLVAWRAHPWFGVGMDNYSQISDARLTGWLAQQGRAYVPAEYARAPHAHNLYVNTLVERGAVGLAALLAMLGTWVFALARYRPDFARDGAGVALWCGSVAGWLVTAAIGVVNTTLHHEHAMLAALSLALWLGTRRGRA